MLNNDYVIILVNEAIGKVNLSIYNDQIKTEIFSNIRPIHTPKLYKRHIDKGIKNNPHT